MTESKKADLFIVGAAKAGTTTIYELLTTHPQVYMSAVKEPNYFASSALLKDNLYYKEKIVSSLNEYTSLFAHGERQDWRGEASVSYLFYPQTAQKIFRYNPSAKIIILLRHPAYRAFSHYLMDSKLGLIKDSFENVLNNGRQEKRLASYFQQYILYGFYYSQVKEYMDVFPSTQVKIILFEDLQERFDDVATELSTFLGLKKPFQAGTQKKMNAAERPKGKITSSLYQHRALRKFLKKIIPAGAAAKIKAGLFETPGESLSALQIKSLKNLYKEDVIKLETLIRKNLSAWYE